jgi:predicted transcriptional regulator
MTTSSTSEKETITFRIPSKKRVELDRIASANSRDRSFVLNEAVNAYLEMSRWQHTHIEQGLKDAKAGRFASQRDIGKAFIGK